MLYAERGNKIAKRPKIQHRNKENMTSLKPQFTETENAIRYKHTKTSNIRELIWQPRKHNT
jgi:hypothetical protein